MSPFTSDIPILGARFKWKVETRTVKTTNHLRLFADKCLLSQMQQNTEINRISFSHWLWRVSKQDGSCWPAHLSSQWCPWPSGSCTWWQWGWVDLQWAGSRARTWSPPGQHFPDGAKKQKNKLLNIWLWSFDPLIHKRESKSCFWTREQSLCPPLFLTFELI